MVGRRNNKGTFLMTDGLDGVGKGQVISAIVEYEKSQGRDIFDCNEWWGNLQAAPIHDYNPRLADIAERALVVSSEPTYAGVGRRIRNEYISSSAKKAGRDYNPALIANAYALDRYELYTTTLIPLMERGQDIVQSRGIVTSLVYQLLDTSDRSEKGWRGYEVEEIMALEGNRLTLLPKFMPTVLVIPTIRDFDDLMQRLGDREKKDDAIFENIDFQRRLKPIYEEEWLQDIFTSRGCAVEYIDAGISVEETRRQAVDVWKKYKNRGE